MNANPVIRNHAYCLAHVPDLVQFGSKPRREIGENAAVAESLHHSLRPFARAASYPPNQVFIGNRTPEELAEIPRPWFQVSDSAASARGSFGEIFTQDAFYAVLKQADILEPPLFELADHGVDLLSSALAARPLLGRSDEPKFVAVPTADIQAELGRTSSLPIYSGAELRGCFRRDDRAEGRDDDNLSAVYLLENLSAKASGALALESLLTREGIGPDKIDFIISCGEEACGDRYQRGGGGMAKAIGQMCGCVNASGIDVKNFCAAPASAIVTAGALVKAGLYQRVVVVGGGSLAKLGMKFQAELLHQVPVLDDCLASVAFLVTENDEVSPVLRLERNAVGLATIGSSTSDEAVYRRLIVDPLETLGLRITDIDKFAPELHNPELMEFAGAGDVARKNYRTIAALAVMTKQIEKSEMTAFINRVGMPGFAPTQGHIPSAVPYLGHAAEAIMQGRVRRAMFLCKASLFLNRMTQLFDGVSFCLEANKKNSG